MSMIGFLISCSSTSSSSVNNTIGNVVNVANTVAEINNLLNGMNLNASQASVIGATLSNYVSQYNSLAQMNTNSSEFKTQFKKYKSSTLTSISSALPGNEYNQFLNALTTISNSNNTNLSSGTINVLSSLVN